jgi:hypothetical protein
MDIVWMGDIYFFSPSLSFPPALFFTCNMIPLFVPQCSVFVCCSPRSEHYVAVIKMEAAFRATAVFSSGSARLVLLVCVDSSCKL